MAVASNTGRAAQRSSAAVLPGSTHQKATAAQTAPAQASAAWSGASCSSSANGVAADDPLAARSFYFSRRQRTRVDRRALRGELAAVPHDEHTRLRRLLVLAELDEQPRFAAAASRQWCIWLVELGAGSRRLRLLAFFVRHHALRRWRAALWHSLSLACKALPALQGF